MVVSTQRLRHNFSRAAAEYDARAAFQHVQTRRVLDAALMVLPEQAVVADIGCGTGYFAQAAAGKRADWKVLGVDISIGMCAVAATRCTAIAVDAARLPLASASVDAAVSSLCYQWVEDHAAAFAELQRVVKPGGRAVVATLGAASLQELRSCAKTAEVPLGLLPMREFEKTRQALQVAGLEITFAEKTVERAHYTSVGALLESMRAIGAGNNFAHDPRRFIGPKRWAAMVTQYESQREAAGIPVTWEHHFFILRKPQ